MPANVSWNVAFTELQRLKRNPSLEVGVPPIEKKRHPRMAPQNRTPRPALDERWLIQRARGGDQSACRALYDAHVDRIYRLMVRMVGDPDAAQDCTQETFINAFDRLDSFRSDSRFSTWVHAIAVRTALNRLRRRKKSDERDVALNDVSVTDRTPSASDPTVRDRLRRAVDDLSDIYRTVFLMHDVEGYKHSEIAETLDIAVGTSKARLSRARETLRETLGDAVREYVS